MPSSGKPHGLARVCRVWGIACATVYWQRHAPARLGARRGPLGPWTDDALMAHIRRVLATSSFPGAGYRKVWARLRHGGLRTAPRRMLRLMRAHQLWAPTRLGHAHGPHAHDATSIPTDVDTMWGTEKTSTVTRQEGQVAILIAVDYCSAVCVGLHAAQQGPRCATLEPLRQGVRTACGAFGHDVAQGVVLRHAHGSQDMSPVFQEALRFLGIASSPAFIRASEGKGCATRFPWTLQENR